ncbi:hypothetical protein D9613_003575 [Agrocybe pediades]|uniref:Aminotransferase class V domain-containing protein n=1 Tax=Agrocybe pediades TaxID=84607 RepID=A0A8H4QJH7_9AGAR|nr:hypothetical protein D9613_003575 [Agrocybe pediades]
MIVIDLHFLRLAVLGTQRVALANLSRCSYGTVPRPVQESAERLSREIEARPDHFLRLKLYPSLAEVRKQLASFLNVKLNELVFTTNASLGLNVALRNFEWEEGDIIFAFSTTYDSISRTIDYLCDIRPFPKRNIINLEFPTSAEEIIALFKREARANPAKPGGKRIAVIDSITALPSVYLPWKELVKICQDEGIWSVIDAAHSIGQEVGLDLSAAAPDFWVSNCHKWLSAKRSCAVLYVPERNQHIIKSSIPTSHAYISLRDRTATNFVDQFEWNGTIDHTPFLTIPDGNIRAQHPHDFMSSPLQSALQFRTRIGGEEKINAYCRDLAFRGGKVVADILGTCLLDPTGDLTLNMVNVQLPISERVPVNKDVHTFIVREILSHNAYSKLFHYQGKWWTRCSAQVWNEVIVAFRGIVAIANTKAPPQISDFEKIGHMWLEVFKKVENLYAQHG